MRLYLAAPWTCKSAAQTFAQILEDAGHTVPCRWWEHSELPAYLSGQETEGDFAVLAEQAYLDLDGVLTADAFVLLNLVKSEGKAVETGVAIASGVPIIVVGPRSNLFHYTSSVEVVATVNECLMALDNMVAAWEGEQDNPEMFESDPEFRGRI